MKTAYSLELARTFGEPLDPRLTTTNLVKAVCEVTTAAPDEYFYYFDVLLETDKTIISNTANGLITQENITPDNPALISFTGISTPEYYFNINDLADGKEKKPVSRKLKTINRALNEEEDYRVITLLDAAVSSSGNTFALRSGFQRFIYKDLVDMVESVQDYGSDFVLIVGSQISTDMKNWIYDDNKFSSLDQAVKDLDVNEVIRIGSVHKVTRDGSVTQVMDQNSAYLVARDLDIKPCLFVRKRVDEAQILGGLINESEGAKDRPFRLVLGSNNPVQVGADRHLAIGVIGYEMIATAVTNLYAVAKYTRS